MTQPKADPGPREEGTDPLVAHAPGQTTADDPPAGRRSKAWYVPLGLLYLSGAASLLYVTVGSPEPSNADMEATTPSLSLASAAPAGQEPADTPTPPPSSEQGTSPPSSPIGSPPPDRVEPEGADPIHPEPVPPELAAEAVPRDGPIYVRDPRATVDALRKGILISLPIPVVTPTPVGRDALAAASDQPPSRHADLPFAEAFTVAPDETSQAEMPVEVTAVVVPASVTDALPPPPPVIALEPPLTAAAGLAQDTRPAPGLAAHHRKGRDQRGRTDGIRTKEGAVRVAASGPGARGKVKDGLPGSTSATVSARVRVHDGGVRRNGRDGPADAQAAIPRVQGLNPGRFETSSPRRDARQPAAPTRASYAAAPPAVSDPPRSVRPRPRIPKREGHGDTPRPRGGARVVEVANDERFVLPPQLRPTTGTRQDR